MDVTGEKLKEIAEQTPFKCTWVDSAYQQTLLPNAPWHQLEEKISLTLARRVEKQFASSQRKEALLQLLGEDFVNTYLPMAGRNPMCLEAPSITLEEKERLFREAQGWLNSQMYKAVKDVGLETMILGPSAQEPPPADFADFLRHTFNIFSKSLDRELYRQEQDLSNKKRQQMMREARFAKLAYKIPAPSRVKPATASTPSSVSSVDKPSSGSVRAMVQKVEGDPPPLWGPQSDEIGKAVLTVLQRDPRKFDHVAGRLHGRQLPGSLRAYMWADVLFKSERKRMKEVIVEKVIRERFGKAVARGMQELRVSRATSSPISGLIETAVIETYNKTTSMVAHKSQEHMKEACRTLNVLYVYDRSYEPYLIHWLFPLQIAFQSQTIEEKKADKGENVYELAMYLDLLNSSCFPNWPQVFAIAEQVMNTLEQGDPDLYNHLKVISRRNVKINPKEFLVQLIHEEKAKAEALLKATPGGSFQGEESAELLADPLVFIRRWIGEGFVSVLDTPSVMYVWDQCFMQNWAHSVLKHFCITLLELLRHKFMMARDYMGMKEVFFVEPCKLYTLDLQIGWIHLESGKDLMDIPYLNRQRPPSAESRIMSLGVDRSSVVGTPIAGFLQPSGIKGIGLKMIIPSEAVQRESWLKTVDTSRLQLHVEAYFGTIHLLSRMNRAAPMPEGITKDNYGNTVYDVFFPQDKFVFENIDLSQYDVEKELGAYPYALIRAAYVLDGGTDSLGRSVVPVGWSRIPLFQRVVQAEATSTSSADINWVLLSGEHTFTLHPGKVPDSLVDTEPRTPSEYGIQEGNVLGYDSKLNAVVYDPRNEPQDKPAVIPMVPPSDTRRKPTPKPSPKPSPVPTPRPRPVPTPRRPRDNKGPWVEHNVAEAKQNPKPTSTKDPFDIYVDSVRFIPDNASIIKVTGRLLRTGQIINVEDIFAIPELDSSARCPEFKYRLPVNMDKKEADGGLIAFIRVYTIDIVDESVDVIGSCLVPMFDMNKKLRVGGHQYRLHNGMPDVKQGIASIRPTDLDEIPIVPSVSVLVRIMPHTQNFVPAPKYSTGYYVSDSCRPTVSEERIFDSYSEHMAYPKSVREMIQRVQQSEGAPQGRTDKELVDWLQYRLDIKKHLPENQPAGNLELVRCVRYKLKNGLKVKIHQAYGLSEGLYIQCFARVAPGSKVLGMEPTPEGYGKEQKFITLKHDFDSFQQAPIWLDDPKEIHPYYDNYSCLIVQLFGLDLKYTCLPDHSGPGKVASTSGHPLTLEDEDRIIGWAVLPLFEGNSVLTGTHYVPVFKGKPSAAILEQLTMNPAQSVLEQQNWSNRNKYNAGSLSVSLWDGHFEYEEVPDWPMYENLLEAVGKLQDYQKARTPRIGKMVANFVIDSLESKYKKQGTTGDIYKKERDFFEDLMTRTFYDLMETALMTAGYGPL